MAKPKTTKSESSGTRPQHSWPVRFVLAHPRLFSSAAIGFLVYLVLLLLREYDLPALPGFFAWDVFVFCFLAAVYWMVWHSDAAMIPAQSKRQDEGRLLVLIGAVVAVGISIAVIVVWLIGGIRDLSLVLLTIALSWGFIHTIFMLHYAHEFYAKHRGPGGGLHFPRDPQPDYWDFVYFAFGVGMAAQVADVAVTSKSIRRFVLFHSIVSFFFNVTLIAMAVSIVGDFISPPNAH